jgi:ElaA protein
MLRLRCEVFVVEQAYGYQDLDNYDQDSHHVIGLEDKESTEVLCCARIVAPGIKYVGASIGRIVTDASIRGSERGKELVLVAIDAYKTLYPRHPITISAQQHLENFYSGLGFETLSTPYQVDGIPHIEMSLIKP